MENWTLLYAFTYPHEAHLVRTLLESEGIEVLIWDEETIQFANMYSGAMGGVRLMVRQPDYEKAVKLLETLDYHVG
jgi:hypothetical protein